MHFATSFVALVGAACATTGLAVPLHQPHANHTHPTAVSLRPAATSTVVAKLVNLETAAAALDARSTEAKKKHKSKHQLEKENKKYAKEAKKQQEKQAKKQEKKKKGGFLGLGRVWHNSPASKISRRSEDTTDAVNAADAIDSADEVIILNNGPEPDAMVIRGRSEQSSSSKKKGVQTMVVPGNVGNVTVLATKENKKQVAHWCGTQLDSFRWDAPCPSPAVFINNPFRGMGKTKTHKKSPSYKCDRGTAAMKYARAKGRKGPLADNLRDAAQKELDALCSRTSSTTTPLPISPSSPPFVANPNWNQTSTRWPTPSPISDNTATNSSSVPFRSANLK